MAEQGGAWMGDPAGVEEDPRQMALKNLLSGALGGGQVDVPADEKRTISAEQKKYSKLLDKQMNAQAQQIQQMKTDLAKRKEKGVDVDLAPLAGYVDYLNEGKSNMLKTYMATDRETEKERHDSIAKMQKAITDAEDKLTDNEVNVLKANLSQQKSQANMNAYIREAGRDSRQAKQQAEQRSKDTLKFSKAITKEMTLESQSFNQLDAALATGESQLVRSNLANYARLVSGEKGVLTDKDIVRVMPTQLQTQMADVLAYFRKNPNVKIGPEWTAPLRRMISIAKAERSRGYGARIEGAKNTFNLAFPGTPGIENVNAAYDGLGKTVQNFFGKPPSEEKKSAGSKDTPDSLLSDFEKWEAEGN